MQPFASPKLMILPAAVSLKTKDCVDGSSISTQLHDVNDFGLFTNKYTNVRLVDGEFVGGLKPSSFSPRKRYLKIPRNAKDLKALDTNCIVEGSSFTFFGRNESAVVRLNSESSASENDVSFNKQWRDGIFSKYECKDEASQKRNFIIPPLPPEYRIHKSNNSPRFPQPKERSCSIPKPRTLGSRMSRACSLITIGSRLKTESYPDPVWGASPSFVQRLSEISSLEVETVRQEKIKKLRKNKKQES